VPLVAAVIAASLAACGHYGVASSAWSLANVVLLWRGEFGGAEESDDGRDASVAEGAINRRWRLAANRGIAFKDGVGCRFLTCRSHTSNPMWHCVSASPFGTLREEAGTRFPAIVLGSKTDQLLIGCVVVAQKHAGPKSLLGSLWAVPVEML
jgi:hypothetical protein